MRHWSDQLYIYVIFSADQVKYYFFSRRYFVVNLLLNCLFAEDAQLPYYVEPRKRPEAGLWLGGTVDSVRHSIVLECPYLQRTSMLLEKALQDELLPALFEEVIDKGNYRLEPAHLAVKYSGLALPNSQFRNFETPR